MAKSRHLTTPSAPIRHIRPNQSLYSILREDRGDGYRPDPLNFPYCNHFGTLRLLRPRPPSPNQRRMKISPYDPITLEEGARLWRTEAEAASLPALRAFCLEEAERCERRIRDSLATPILL